MGGGGRKLNIKKQISKRWKLQNLKIGRLKDLRVGNLDFGVGPSVSSFDQAQDWRTDKSDESDKSDKFDKFDESPYLRYIFMIYKYEFSH